MNFLSFDDGKPQEKLEVGNTSILEPKFEDYIRKLNGGKIPGGSYVKKEIVSNSADDNYNDDAELSEEDSFSNENI